jgi:hypothetical protein
MRFLLGSIFGAFNTGSRAFRAPSCSSYFSWCFVSTRGRNLLATIGELLRLQRRPAESDYCALVPSPHINRCQDAADRGKMIPFVSASEKRIHSCRFWPGPVIHRW